MQSSLIGKFSEIFQKGFAFQTRVGISIETFLCGDLGLDLQYVKTKISTVFLDGKVVDSIETALIREGATLALSSAMPGLAGATLRRSGPYASLRSSITYLEHEGNAACGEGRISIKLFNVLIEELGPLFLKKGIIVESSELRDFLARQGTAFRRGCSSILLDGRVVDCETFLSGNPLAENGEAALTVLTESFP